MGRELTTHGCGKSWLQRGNRTGHCSQCHETFEGNTLFDAHFDRTGGGLRCRDPREMKINGEPLVFDGAHGDGSWRGASTIFDPSAIWGTPGTSGRATNFRTSESTSGGES